MNIDWEIDFPILSEKDKIREEGSSQENTTMHRVSFKPTEKYKLILHRREMKARKEKDTNEDLDIE